MPLFAPPPLTHPGYRASRYYSTFDGASAANVTPAAADTLYVYPYPVRASLTAAALLARVITAGAGSAMKMAVYANSPLLELPVGAPLLVNNTGVATTSSGANVSVSVSGSLSPGVYWFAQKYTGTLPQLVGPTTSQWQINGMIGRVSGGALNVAAFGFSVSDTYSNNFPTLTGGESWADVSASSLPIIFIGT